MAKKIFSVLFAAIFVAATFFVVINPKTVYAQTDPNDPRWDDPAWVQNFVDGKVNAVFSSEFPLPEFKDLPQKVKDALTHGGYVVLIEPWRIGCPTDPVNDPNCNVGYVESFTDWKELYNTAYGEVEANPGHTGPWTDGSVHITYIREMTPDEMSESDWAIYANGDLKVDFAENKPLPETDPTNGTVAHMLIEPWRHTCIGKTTDPDCNVGKSGTFQTWKEMKDYLKEGNWTRGSIISMPKSTASGGNLPTAVAPNSGTTSDDGQSTNIFLWTGWPWIAGAVGILLAILALFVWWPNLFGKIVAGVIILAMLLVEIFTKWLPGKWWIYAAFGVALLIFVFWTTIKKFFRWIVSLFHRRRQPAAPATPTPTTNP